MSRLPGKQLTALTAVVLGLVVMVGGPVRLAAGSGIGGQAPPGVVADHGQIVDGPAAQQPVVRTIGQAPVPVGAVPAAALLVAVLFFSCLARYGGSRLPAASLVRRQRGRSPPGVPIS